MDLLNKDKIRIKLNASKIIEEFMNEKSHNLPLEQLLGEESKILSQKPFQKKASQKPRLNLDASDTENYDEYLTLNSSKYNQISNPKTKNYQYQIAPTGGFHYYPQNLQKRLNMNTSKAVPLETSDDSIQMLPTQKFSDTRINEKAYVRNQYMAQNESDHIHKDDLILDIKFKNSQDEKKMQSQSNNNSHYNFHNASQLPALPNMK